MAPRPGWPEDAGREAVRQGCAALAAGATAEAAQWFARARRIAPDDAAAAYLLAAALAEQAPEQALGLLDALLATAPRQRAAQLSRLALLHRLGRTAAAAQALDALLCRFVLPAAPWFAALADAVCAAAGQASGWVGVASDGRVHGRGATALRLGGQPLPDAAGWRLPPDWRRHGGVLRAGGGVLGARIDLAALARIDGAVIRPQGGVLRDGVVRGWAVAMADPDTPPRIAVFAGTAAGAPLATACADDATTALAGDALAGDGLAAARGFAIPVGTLPPGTTLHVRAETGRRLAGSPLRLAAPRRRAVAGAARPAPSWAAGRRDRAVVLVTHAAGGGVERVVAARAAALHDAGARAILVRPGTAAATPPAQAVWGRPERLAPPSGFLVGDAVAPAQTRPVADVEALADLLRDDRPELVELHHVAAHDPAVLRLAGLLRVPFDVIVHDFAALCPRVTLCGGAASYCGEPGDPHACEDCIADHGARIPLAGSVAAHRATQSMLLCAARRVVAPSHDAAARLRRFMPRLAPVVTPWEDDRALTAAVRRPAAADGTVTVACVGAIGLDKGFAVLLACARDAARRDLPLRFVLVGHSIDDARLLATGRAFVTGRFAEGEAPALLAEFAPALGLLPSVWPETWCFALSALWQAGLHVLAFELGAQAERIAATGAGSLLPLGSGAGAINDRCLALARPGAAAAVATAGQRRPRLIVGGRQAHG